MSWYKLSLVLWFSAYSILSQWTSTFQYKAWLVFVRVLQHVVAWLCLTAPSYGSHDSAKTQEVVSVSSVRVTSATLLWAWRLASLTPLAVDPHKSPPPTPHAVQNIHAHTRTATKWLMFPKLCVVHYSVNSGLLWRRQACRGKPVVVIANINKLEPKHVRCRYD